MKDTMEDLENKAKSALHSAPEISREQLPIVRKQQKRYCIAVALRISPVPTIRKRM
jgi:hypothetical protein